MTPFEFPKHTIEELIPIIKQVMKDNDVRSFGECIIKNDFGEPMVAIHGHIMDLMHCDIDKLFIALEVATSSQVAYGEQNYILIRPLPEQRPGTIGYRFNYLMDELEKRFPEGTVHRQLCSEPPESHMLREIDAYLAQHPKKMVCPRCDVEMVPGIAIDPKREENVLYAFPLRPLAYEDVDLIVVMKCPKCGHSDDGK